jgi:hypothetical protein
VANSSCDRLDAKFDPEYLPLGKPLNACLRRIVYVKLACATQFMDKNIGHARKRRLQRGPRGLAAKRQAKLDIAWVTAKVY